MYVDIREIGLPRNDWPQRLKTRYAKIYPFL